MRLERLIQIGNRRGRHILGGVLAAATALAGVPTLGSQDAPTPEAGAPPPVEAPASAAPAAGSPEASPSEASASAPRPTLEQIRSAMLEAEQRRAEAMRPDPGVPKEVAERWGVEVIRVASSADGFWLDFRFRVTDVDKALPLFDSRIKPYVELAEGGVRLAVPTAAKVGALRTTNRGGNIRPDTIYAIMFSNPGRYVKPGQKVSVVIGDFRVEHLTVN